MIVEFHDGNGESAHNDFQDWRRENESGFFINVRSRDDQMLHRASCSHAGNTEWKPEDHDDWGSLTKSRKICSTDIRELQDRIEEEGGIIILKVCGDCKPI